jgi:hypothetical protein
LFSHGTPLAIALGIHRQDLQGRLLFFSTGYPMSLVLAGDDPRGAVNVSRLLGDLVGDELCLQDVAEEVGFVLNLAGRTDRDEAIVEQAVKGRRAVFLLRRRPCLIDPEESLLIVRRFCA